MTKACAEVEEPGGGNGLEAGEKGRVERMCGEAERDEPKFANTRPREDLPGKVPLQSCQSEDSAMLRYWQAYGHAHACCAAFILVDERSNVVCKPMLDGVKKGVVTARGRTHICTYNLINM